MITQAELKTIVSYDSSTGIFTKLKTNKTMGTKQSNGRYSCMINGVRYPMARLAYIYMLDIAPNNIKLLDGTFSNMAWSNLTIEKFIKDAISQSILKRIYLYDVESGHFTKRTTGKIAGTTIQRGYVHIGVAGKKYLAHRLVFLYMTGEFPSSDIDHINHITSDNRWSNLREVTKSDNSRNASLSKNNNSGTTGVIWQKDRSKWTANIRVHGKRIHLGCFLDINDAVKARKEAEVKYNFHKNHGLSKD